MVHRVRTAFGDSEGTYGGDDYPDWLATQVITADSGICHSKHTPYTYPNTLGFLQYANTFTTTRLKSTVTMRCSPPKEKETEVSWNQFAHISAAHRNSEQSTEYDNSFHSN